MVKAELYARLEELGGRLAGIGQAGVGPEPFGLFDEEQLAEPVRREVSPQQFAEEHRVPLDGLLDRLGAYLDKVLELFPRTAVGAVRGHHRRLARNSSGCCWSASSASQCGTP